MGFVGRPVEIAVIVDAIERSERFAGGRLVFFSGGAGLGKSRLAKEAVAIAEARGFVTAWGRCRETEGAPAFWPWMQILRTVRAAFGTQPEVLPDLEAANGTLDPMRVHDAVARGLASLSASRPLVLVLDDLHVADPGSLRMLRFVAGEIEAARMVVIGTYREDEGSEALKELIGEVVTAGTVRLVRLDGLSVDAVAELIAATSGTTVAPDVACTVHARTSGNPFFVTELARLGLDGPPPESVREAIRARLRRLPAQTRAVLATASVLGRDFGGELLDVIADLRGAPLIAALQPAAQAGLIAADVDRHGQYRFVHALVQEVIYADLDPLARRRFHARAVDALDASPDAPRAAHLDELAFHACAATADEASRRRAALLCEEAARRAKASLAFDDASRWFEKCVDLDPSRRTLDLVMEHARTLEGRRAREQWECAFAMAVDANHGEAAARAALGVGDVVVSAGMVDHALVRLLEHASRLVAEGSAWSVRIDARLAVELYWQNDRVPARQASVRAVERAEALGDDKATGAALHAQRFVLRGPDDLLARVAIGDRLVALAQRSRDEELELQASAWLVPERMTAGDMAAFDRELAVIDHLASRVGNPVARWYAHLFRGMRTAFSARFEEALAEIEYARALGRRIGSQPSEMYAAGQRAVVLRETGRAEESVHEIRDLAASYPILVSLQCELAMLLAETGATAEARERLDRVAGHDFALIPRDSLWHASMAFCAQAAAVLGNAARAKRAAEMLRPYLGLNIVQGVPIAWGAVDHWVGVALVAAGQIDEASRHFTEAIRLHAAWGAHALHVASQAELCNALHARGRADDRERVTGLEASVRADAARLGIVRPLLARERPNKKGGLPTGLTERETEVIRLVAVGLANKEIATQLRISPHTVERHLANVYMKIGARNRAEATAWAVTHGLSST